MEQITNGRKGWIISLLGGLFFFYSLLLSNMMTSFNGAIAESFHASIKDIGLLSAVAFYSNLLLAIPAGLLLDRFSVRNLMLSNLGLAVVSVLICAFATNIQMMILGRLLTGVMMAFAFIASLKLASYWLSPNSMTLASSLIVTIGMLGGMVGQTPISYFITNWGWREAMGIVAVIGGFIAFVLWFAISLPKKEVSVEKEAKKMGVWKELLKVISFGQNWYAGGFIALINFPVAILGAAFGTSYLMSVYNLSLVTAASINSMLFLGMIFGAPVFGSLANRLHNKRVPMFLGSILCLLFTIGVLYYNGWSILVLHILFFLVGFTSGAQVLGYPIITESNPPKLIGSALSLAVILIMGGGYGLGIAIEGGLIDWASSFMPLADAYRWALSMIPIGVAVGIGLLFLIKSEVKK